MAHAKPEDLKDLKSLLKSVRGLVPLIEKTPRCFYLKSKAVLHFHTKKGRRFAHVFDGKTWKEIDLEPNPTATRQTAIFKTISKILPLK